MSVDRYWIEEYSVCGCSAEFDTKGELLGYCRHHGHSWIMRYNTGLGVVARNPKPHNEPA